MAKENEKKLAKVMFVEQRKTAKEIAARLCLTENTVGKWIKEGGWKEQQEAHLSRPEMLINSYDELLQALVEKRLNMEHSNADPKEKVALSDEIAKVSKAREAAQKESRIPLATYLNVMESIFQAMQERHPKIYLSLIEFQDEHISKIAKQLN